MGVLDRVWPYAVVIFLQFGYAGLTIFAKSALDHGMNAFTFVVYRHAVASLVLAPFAMIKIRNTRPRLTLPIFLKIMALGFLEPVADQAVYYTGLRYTSATFAAAMSNTLPSLAFILAWIFREIRSMAKVFGTVMSLSGAMVMTLVHGPMIRMPWLRPTTSTPGTLIQGSSSFHDREGHSLKGPVLVFFGCFCWSCFIILQAFVLRDYPAALPLATLVCVMGAVEGALVVLLGTRGDFSIWMIGWNSELFTIVYAGVLCSGVAYYFQGLVMKKKGPVFVSAFSPLGMIIVAVTGSFILHEETYLGRVIGAVMIIAGLYSVVWGKLRDHTEVLLASDTTAEGAVDANGLRDGAP